MAERLGRRIARDEEGIALASTIAIMLIVLVVTAVGAFVVVASLSQTRSDRASADAFQAADGGIDAVTYRMNKQLLASQITSLGGLTAAALETLGCVDLDAGLLILDSSTSACEFEIDSVGGTPATCRSDLGGGLSLPLDLTALPLVSPGGPSILTRTVTCSATVNDRTRRITASLELRLNLSRPGEVLGSPLSVWRRTGWAECPAGDSDPCPVT